MYFFVKYDECVYQSCHIKKPICLLGIPNFLVLFLLLRILKYLGIIYEYYRYHIILVIICKILNQANMFLHLVRTFKYKKWIKAKKENRLSIIYRSFRSSKGHYLSGFFFILVFSNLFPQRNVFLNTRPSAILYFEFICTRHTTPCTAKSHLC